MIFKPLLACDADLNTLRFPLLASAKLDGVRAIVRDGMVYSRSNKPISNKYVQSAFGHLQHLDGELIVGDPRSKTAYRDTVSHVMSLNKINFDLRYYVFDHIGNMSDRYQNRLVQVNRRQPAHAGVVVTHVQHVIHNVTALLALEETLLNEGYEGLILRDPDAHYKMGRSTAKEQILLKLKRFTDNEYAVVGFEERMRNDNVATTNELGRTARSSHQENKNGRGDLGALVLQGDGFTFNCGTGLTDQERDEIWQNRPTYLGRLAKVKHFLIGAKDKPRHPVFLGWRDRSDT